MQNECFLQLVTRSWKFTDDIITYPSMQRKDFTLITLIVEDCPQWNITECFMCITRTIVSMFVFVSTNNWILMSPKAALSLSSNKVNSTLIIYHNRLAHQHQKDTFRVGVEPNKKSSFNFLSTAAWWVCLSRSCKKLGLTELIALRCLQDIYSPYSSNAALTDKLESVSQTNSRFWLIWNGVIKVWFILTD